MRSYLTHPLAVYSVPIECEMGWQTALGSAATEV